MKKSELVWLLIRSAGVLAVFYGFLVCVEAVQTVVTVSAQTKGSPGIVSFFAGLYFVKAAFFVVLGLYLLKDGKLLFRLLDSEGEDDQDGPSLLD